MRAFVLDCSVTMAWCFEDECDTYADRVLGALVDATAVVPPIWALEVANVLLVAERNRRISGGDSTRFLSLLETLSIEVETISTERTMASVLSRGRELRLSSYDASYIDVAARNGLPLATRDRALRAACRKCGVEPWSP